MVSVFVSESEFAQLKARYGTWQAEGFPEVDCALLREVVEKFNSLPGVVTVSSCVGHYSTARQLKTPFYVYLAVAGEQGRQALQAVFERLAARLMEVLRIHRANAQRGNMPSHALIDYRNLQLATALKDVQLSSEQKLTYCCWTLVAKGTHAQPHRDNFLRELSLAIDKVQLPEENQ